MSAVPKPRPSPQEARIDEPQRLLLHNVSWEQYVQIVDAMGERPIHLTYDRGTLEFMTLSYEHERWKESLRCLIQVLAEEMNVDIAGAGSTTFKGELIQRALEPDECYYTKHMRQVRGLRRIDLKRDPPPDLVVEIDVTRSSINRMAIYASMKVPEAWRFDGAHLHVYRLRHDESYEEIDSSPTFPRLPLDVLVKFMGQGVAEGDTSMIRSFRAWVREHLVKTSGRGKPKKKR